MSTLLPSNLLIGDDRKLYVKKVIGPAAAPLFEVVLPAGDADLPKERVSGSSLNLTEHFPKISMRNMVFVHAYFAAIYEKFKSEAIVLFHRDPGATDYTVVVPESYSATATSLTYDHSQPRFCTTCRVCSTQEIDVCPRCNTNTMVKTEIYGTAHSHGSMSAFHSGTDDAHEKNQTGFHITFGNVNQGLFSVCPSFVTALNGYTDKDGFGIRHYPKLEELVDLPNPLTVEDRARIQLWTSVLFNEEILSAMPSDQAVVFERRQDTLMAVFTSPNQEYAHHWCSMQPRGRDLQVYTASKIKEALSQQKNKALSKSGLSTTKAYQKHQYLAGTGVSQTPGETTKMSGSLVSIGEQSATTGTKSGCGTKPTTTPSVGTTTDLPDLLVSDFVFSEKLEKAGVVVCIEEVDESDVYVFNTGTGELIDPWENIFNNLSTTSFDDGVFATWAAIYALHQMVKAIDDIVPAKTSFFQKDYDDLVEKLSEVISDHVGGPADAAKELLSQYSIDKMDSADLIEKNVNRVISVADIPTIGKDEFGVAVAAQMFMIASIQSILEHASRLEVLPAETVDAVNAEIKKIVSMLLELYQKDIVGATT